MASTVSIGKCVLAEDDGNVVDMMLIGRIDGVLSDTDDLSPDSLPDSVSAIAVT